MFSQETSASRPAAYLLADDRKAPQSRSFRKPSVGPKSRPSFIFLHGHFFELVTGHGDYAPRKHTVNVQPGGTAAFDFTADAVGDWAFHCHMLYHMHAGMMQVVTVRPRGEAA